MEWKIYSTNVVYCYGCRDHCSKPGSTTILFQTAMPALLHRRNFTRLFAWGAGALLTSAAGSAGILQVGPTRKLRKIADAARVAAPGQVIEVDAGTYLADVAVWEQPGLVLRAVGGRARLHAQGAAAEGKGIWVVRSSSMRVEGFDFEGAAVPSRNGAGIRFERGVLQVRDCRFKHNEMGLLTNNDPNSVLIVEDCEFAHNMRPDGHNHNLYVGRIARLAVSGSYFHHARTGHLLKSRARVNMVFCNRLIDEPGGTASYELEFPDGGVAHVVGNLIGQNAQTENNHLVSFGAEGYKWPRNAIYMVNNTLVNLLPRNGVFLRVAPRADAVCAINNLLLGEGNLEAAGPGDYRSNFTAEAADFVDASALDFRPRTGVRWLGKAVDPGEADGRSLRPDREYVYPRGTRALDNTAHNPGAMQRLALATTS